MSIGHISPEAAEGGAIALVEEGDRIEIDIPDRSIRLDIAEEEMVARRERMVARGAGAWKPRGKDSGKSRARSRHMRLWRPAHRVERLGIWHRVWTIVESVGFVEFAHSPGVGFRANQGSLREFAR